MNDKSLTLPNGISLHRGKLRIAFRPPGHKNQVKRSLGLLPTKANIKVAEMKLNAIRNDLMIGRFDIGQHFANDPLSKTTPYTVRELMQTYFLDWEEGRKNNTETNYTSTFNTIVLGCGNSNIKQMDAAGAIKMRELLRQVTTDDQTNNFIAKISRACNRAINEKKLEHNPFVTMERISTKKADDIDEPLTTLAVYTIAEAERLIQEFKTPEQKRLFTFLFWTGMRHGEAAALQKEDVDLPYLTIRRNMSQRGVVSTPKTSHGRRRIYLPQKAIEVLVQQMATHDNGEVWTRRYSQPFKDNKVISKSAWDSAIKRAGLRRLVPYRTRHSFISWMLAVGEQPMTVAAHVGHRNTKMLEQKYAHFIPKSDPKWTLDDPAIFEGLKKSMDSKA